MFVRLCLDLHVYYKYSIFLMYSRDVRVIEKQGLSGLCLECVCVCVCVCVCGCVCYVADIAAPPQLTVRLAQLT